MQMNTPPLPPITPSDLSGILALAAFCKDPDAVAAVAADLAAQQGKINDLIRQSEALNAEQAEIVKQIDDKQAALDIAIDAHNAQKAADAKTLSDLANTLNLKSAELTDRDASAKEREDAVMAREVASKARENAIAEKEKQAQKALDEATAMRADLARRLAIIDQARASA